MIHLTRDERDSKPVLHAKPNVYDPRALDPVDRRCLNLGRESSEVASRDVLLINDVLTDSDALPNRAPKVRTLVSMGIVSGDRGFHVRPSIGCMP